MSEKKFARETFASTSKIILPNETNTLGNLMGGQLLNWMDINAAISAQRHCRRVVVTAAVNNVSFNKAVKLGDILSIESKVSRAFNSSMEVFLDVYTENHRTGKRTKCRSEEHTSELQSRPHLVCRLLLEKKKKQNKQTTIR